MVRWISVSHKLLPNGFLFGMSKHRCHMSQSYVWTYYTQCVQNMFQETSQPIIQFDGSHVDSLHLLWWIHGGLLMLAILIGLNHLCFCWLYFLCLLSCCLLIVILRFCNWTTVNHLWTEVELATGTVEESDAQSDSFKSGGLETIQNSGCLFALIVAI